MQRVNATLLTGVLAAALATGCASREESAGAAMPARAGATSGNWIGKTAAGFALPGIDGKLVDVGQVLGAQLGQSKAELEKAGAAVFALSDEGPEPLRQMRDRNQADSITFLSDAKGEAARKYAGTYPGKTTLKPATFVIDKNGKIVYAYLNEDYRTRAATDAVVAAVRKAAQ
jgi:hypothetical protein